MSTFAQLAEDDIVRGSFFGRRFAARVILNLPYTRDWRELHLRTAQPLHLAGKSSSEFCFWVNADAQMLSLDGERVLAWIDSIEFSGSGPVEYHNPGPATYAITPVPPPERSLSGYLRECLRFMGFALFFSLLAVVALGVMLFAHGCHYLH